MKKLQRNPLERIQEIKTQNSLLLTYNKPKEITYHVENKISDNIWGEEVVDSNYTPLTEIEENNFLSVIPRIDTTNSVVIQNLVKIISSNSFFKNLFEKYFRRINV